MENRPFEPFIVFVADGRELRIVHPEMASTGRALLTLHIVLEGGQIEVLDASFITALRTVHASMTTFD
jgi:hypothetical protein